ncbi:PEP-CTERM sorting domain-containing protein [Pirellulimonas nuda]|uniref:PEP-CTERM sorting domain-containing protein n=1 Tax=Pirellulimonas nuda TaxID=2528009 RepID=UPI00119F88AB|nr:PEP-CTERM sorting domain-containing protein [Pirellulimonas nuda]
MFPGAKAIQDVTVFATASINPTGQELFFDDLFGVSSAGIVRETQVGDSIDLTLTGWAFEGSNALGDYRFGAVGPFTGADYSGVITNVVQDPTDPGFSTGAPSSFVSGDVFLTGSSFAFEFLSGPLAGIVLVTDPAQNFAFEASFDGLPPSLGTVFTPTAGSDAVLNVYLTDASGALVEWVGTSSDRRVITTPEPGSLTLLGLLGLLGFLPVRKRRAMACARC